MSSADVIQVLLGFLQLGIVGFVTYWIKRIQAIERMIADTSEQRTNMLIEYERRVSILETKIEQVLENQIGLREDLKAFINAKKLR